MAEWMQSCNITSTQIIWCHIERFRGKQEFASHIPHIALNQGQRSEGLMYVADMLSYLKEKKKKKRSCFRVTIFTHLCTWHFCDPLRRRRLRVSVNVSCQPVFSLFCRPHFIWNIHIVYKKCTLHLALLHFDPCIN